MGVFNYIFAKPEYKEMLLPYTYDENEDDASGGMFFFEFYANVLGEYKYSSVCYLAKTDYPEALAEKLRVHNGEKVKVIFKIKNGKVKTVEIDLDNLAQVCDDESFRDMEVIAWGYDVKSIEEVKREENFNV